MDVSVVVSAPAVPELSHAVTTIRYGCIVSKWRQSEVLFQDVICRSLENANALLGLSGLEWCCPILLCI